MDQPPHTEQNQACAARPAPAPVPATAAAAATNMTASTAATTTPATRPRRSSSATTTTTAKKKKLQPPSQGSLYDTVQALLERVASTQEHHQDAAGLQQQQQPAQQQEPLAAGGPLTVSELSQLSWHCTAQTSSSSSGAANQRWTRDELYELQDLLAKHVQAASLVDLGAHIVETVTKNHKDTEQPLSPSQLATALEQYWTSSGRQEQTAALETGLQAAAVCLVMATLPAAVDDDDEEEDDEGSNNKQQEQLVAVPVLHETALEACSTLLFCHTTRHVLSNNSVSVASSSSRASATASSPSPVKKAKTIKGRGDKDTSSSSSSNNNMAKAVQQQWLRSAHHNKVLQQTVLPWQLLLLERWLRLVQQSKVRLDEAIFYRLVRTVLLALEGDQATALSSRQQQQQKTNLLFQQVQRASLDLLVALFHYYPSPTMRDSLIQDVVSLWLRANTLTSANNAVRQYPVVDSFHQQQRKPLQRMGGSNNNSQGARACTLLTRPPSLLPASCLSASSSASGNHQHRIQMTTALLVQLVQTVVVRPTFRSDKKDDDDKDNSGSSEEQEESEEQQQLSDVRLVSGLQPCRAATESFISYLFQRVARTKEDLNSPTAGAAHHHTSAADLRPRLTHLVDDLLSLLWLPSYPAAEMLLTSLMRQLHRDLMAYHHEGQALEHMYQTMAVEMLGKICAVEARLLAWQGEHALHMTGSVNKKNPTQQRRSALTDEDGDVEMSNVAVDCLCGRDHVRDILLIDCDRCQCVFHAPCVGFYTQDTIPADWMCDACRLTQIVDRKRSKLMATTAGQAKSDNTNTLVTLVDETYALQQAVLSTVLAQPTQDDGVVARFHLARWADELEQKAATLAQQESGPTATTTGANNKVLTQVLENWEHPLQVGRELTEEGSIRAVLSLVSTTSTLLLTFRNQVKVLLQLMSDQSTPLMRKLSIKAIEKTMKGDSNLMLLPIVTKAVSRRLTDASISVREAAVALVGSYVVQSPAIANTFHSSLLACLTDDGVSVRKRAIRIFQAILSSNPDYKGRTAVLVVMLQCAADPKEEDGVRDLILDLFEKLWLLDGDVVVTSKTKTPKPDAASLNSTTPFQPARDMVVSRSGSTSVVTPTPPPSSQSNGTPLIHRKKVEIAAHQMMEVVKATRSGSELEPLLKKLLGESDIGGGRKLAERKKRRESSQKHCGQLANALFELLLSIEEQPDHRGSRMGKDLSATLETIVVLAEVSPTSVFSHVDTILPYLKADNGVSFDDETAIVAATCEVVYRLTPFFDAQELDRLGAGSLPKDLVQITYKFGNAALSSAVRALSALVEHSDITIFRETLLKLAKTFYSFLCRRDEVEDFSRADEKTRSNTHRALRVLGLICQYNNTSVNPSMWGDEDESSGDDDLLDAAALNESNLLPTSYRVVSKYLVKRDNATKCKALQALGGIFMSQPRLLLKLEQLGLIAEVMSDEAHPSLQLEALQCWRSILEEEEKRIDGGHAEAKMEADSTISVKERIAGDQEGDSTLFGGVLTGHAPRLFQMTHSPDRRIRFAVLELLGVLLRQGLVNPNEAVAYLFALQGDVENDNIRSLALKLLMTEGDKRPNILRQHICAGVKEAYAFQQAVYSNTSASAVIVSQRGKSVQVECIFSTVFLECAAGSRKHRHGLFKNLLKLFDLSDSNPVLLSPRRKSKSKKSSKKDAFPLLAFASQILAHLPYSTASDPLLIIYEISSMVTLQGAQVLDQFANLLRPVGLASDDKFDETNVVEDALERAARSKFPSRTQESRPMSSEEFDMAGFLNLCVDAAALILLLRLKSFLRKLYNLSETRCLEYDPNAKGSAADKAVTKGELSKPFDSTIPMAMHNKKMVDKDALIRQYAEFRRLMRAESSYERSSSSEGEDEKEATASETRKRKASGDSEELNTHN